MSSRGGRGMRPAKLVFRVETDEFVYEMWEEE